MLQAFRQIYICEKHGFINFMDCFLKPLMFLNHYSKKRLENQGKKLVNKKRASKGKNKLP